MTCLTSTEFALDNRQLSIVSYAYTTAWKRKTMPYFSGGVVTRLVQSYLLPFHKRVCHLRLSALIFDPSFFHNGNTHSCSSLQEGLASLHGCYWLAKLKTFWHNYSITALRNASMCAVSLPSHLNSKLKQTAYSVKPTPESIEHPVSVSTAWQSVRQPHQMPNGRESYSLPSGMIPWS